MLRNTDHCKEYKNGNLLIKYDEYAIEQSKKDSLSTLASVLEEIDCYFIGETYCISNYAMGHTIYNCYSDLCYIFAWNDIETLEQGKTLKLYARKPDEWDRELIEREYA